MTRHVIRLPFGRLIITIDVILDGDDFVTAITGYETKRGELLHDVAIEGDDVGEVSRLAVEQARAQRATMENHG